MQVDREGLSRFGHFYGTHAEQLGQAVSGIFKAKQEHTLLIRVEMVSLNFHDISAEGISSKPYSSEFGGGVGSSLSTSY